MRFDETLLSEGRQEKCIWLCDSLLDTTEGKEKKKKKLGSDYEKTT